MIGEYKRFDKKVYFLRIIITFVIRLPTKLT